ncbi:MAG: hypothetical protein A2Y03_06505 [Omnitrophica WOR_2 bacterium GWF2_38_59]|nr:MAG: hypothetical protein A2Y03_06505 [Omnitrophica WOR_2 bacterium GWF2_38_59]OGX50498.1 MAG: hypothetical protein A2243_02070 [Omnitrophica WOR_2 bacterium RIFOXYA2_FULL_38_17]OGX59507.1 MAG: hypothetical protein A2306_09695 [Omnitrophica WOR_2 bacterium RIFOXYB2_FULL_38_16]HBG62026.1 hypothetical protein [Candidatus Omnitrophota bacterium]
MRKIWVISPYGKKSEIYGHETYSKDRKDKGFNAVWQYDLQNGTIALGGSFIGNPEGKSEDVIKREIMNSRGFSSVSAAHYAKDHWRFYNEIKEGDIVIAKKGISVILGFGKVVKRKRKIRFYSEEKGLERTGNKYNPHSNFLNVDWIGKGIEFDERVFRIGRFKPLNEMLIKSKYSKYAPIIMDSIKQYFG